MATLSPYLVTLHEDIGDTFKLMFECQAEDDDHAAEQALSAYPNGEVLHTLKVWSGSPCPDGPDNYWIDDKTGERIKAP